MNIIGLYMIYLSPVEIEGCFDTCARYALIVHFIYSIYFLYLSGVVLAFIQVFFL